jgi:hypothetical protein
MTTISQSSEYERFLKKSNRTTLFPVSPHRNKKVKVDREAIEQELKSLCAIDPSTILPSVFPLVKLRIDELVEMKRSYDKVARLESAREYSDEVRAMTEHVVGDGRGEVLSGFGD